ncbi:MAG: MFS transporter [Elusimicrobiaceae bacterium]
MTDTQNIHWVVISVCFASFMSKLNIYIVNVALPTIARYYGIGTGEASLIVLSLLLFTAGTTLVFGKLADGRYLKNVFLGGYLLFVFSSLLCGLAPTIGLMISARALQGVAGAALAVSSIALIPRLIPAEKRGWAFGIAATSAALGITIGAPLGGVITGYFSWRWVFFVNVPVGIFAFFIARKFIPDVQSGEAESGTGFDWLGAFLSFAALCSFMYALNRGRDEGWFSAPILGALVLSAGFSVWFVRRETGLSRPLLDMNIFSNRRFSLAVLSACLVFMVISAVSFFMPFQLELLKGLKPQYVGFLMMIYSLAIVLFAPFAGRLADRVPSCRVCGAGLFAGAAACLLFSYALGWPGVLAAALFLAIFGVAMAFFIPANNYHIMSLALPGERGAASGVYNTMQTVSMALGVGVFEAIFSQALPAGREIHEVSPAFLVKGFRLDFCLASVLLFAALGATLYAGRFAGPAEKKG